MVALVLVGYDVVRQSNPCRAAQPEFGRASTVMAASVSRAVPDQERGIYAASIRDVLGRWNNATPFAVRMMKRRERRAPLRRSAALMPLQRTTFKEPRNSLKR